MPLPYKAVGSIVSGAGNVPQGLGDPISRPGPLTLPIGTPAPAPLPGPLDLEAYDARPAFIDNIEALATSQGTLVQVSAPTLLRVDTLIGAGATGPIYASFGFAASIRLAAVSERTQIGGYPGGGGGIPSPFAQVLRGCGPYLWLPRAGRWRVYLISGIGLVNCRGAECSLLENMDPGMAESIMNSGGGQPNDIWVENEVIPALGTVVIPSGVAALAAGFVRFWGMTHLALFNIGAATCVLQIGRLATAVSGQPIAAGANPGAKAWNELAGCSVSVFSTAGTTISYRFRTI